MGLDMYAYAVEKDAGNTQFSFNEAAKREDIAYWRKFNALHGLMVRLRKSNETALYVGYSELEIVLIAKLCKRMASLSLAFYRLKSRGNCSLV